MPAPLGNKYGVGGTTGRPRKYGDKDVEEICKKLESYIDSTEIPIVAEFAYQNNIPRTDLYDYEAFRTLLKKLRDKKEANLERGGLEGSLNPTLTVFSLKQLGWSDKHEHEHSGPGGGPMEVKNITYEIVNTEENSTQS